MRVPRRELSPSHCIVPRQAPTALRRTTLYAPAQFVCESGALTSTCLRCEDRPCVVFTSEYTSKTESLSLGGVCPVGAMTFSGDMPMPESSAECIGCGICVLRCPFGALFIDDQSARATCSSPERAEDYTSASAADVKALAGALVRELALGKKGIAAEAERLTANAAKSNQDSFYPLVGSLLTTLGLPTRVTRRGDTGIRFDALIACEGSAVPIEIKSPTEVSATSIKAVQQALENRVVLLSRRLFTTGDSHSSLVVSYAHAAARSDVSALVDDIWSAYGIRIGLIDLATLYGMAIGKAAGAWVIRREDVLELRGVL